MPDLANVFYIRSLLTLKLNLGIKRNNADAQKSHQLDNIQELTIPEKA